MNYIDGFVSAVETEKKEVYKKHVEKIAPVFKKHGAVDFIECWGEDVPEGEITSFPKAVQLQPNETVVLSWIAWPSKEVRDAGMQNAMDELKDVIHDMPFDGKRLIFAGFDVLYK